MAKHFYGYETCSRCSWFYKLKNDYDYWRNTFQINAETLNSGLDCSKILKLRNYEKEEEESKRKVLKRENN